MNGSQQRVVGKVAIAAGLVLLGVLLVAPAAFAQGQEPVTVPGPAGFNILVEPAQATAVTADDGGSWELGVEGTAGNLPNATAAERYGMWAWLNGWFVRRFSFDESSAWEEDFKRSSRGGTENSWLDTVDLMFYVGHGSPGNFTFDNNSHDDGTLDASIDCDTAWGDGDNEWLALTSCQVLADTGIGPMAQCMNRQHLILGFVTNASAHNNYWDTQAYHFGRYMRYGYSMTQAWFNACDVADRYRIVRVIAEETNCFNDNPYYSSVCGDTYDSDYYWYTHYCGTESASYIPTATLEEVPVFQVTPLSTAPGPNGEPSESEAMFNQLGNAFQVTPTVGAGSVLSETVPQPPPPEDPAFFVETSDGQSLQMDQTSGQYQYTNLNALWNEAEVESAFAVAAADGSAVNAISQDDAKAIADAFLTNNGLMDSDAEFFEVVQDAVGTLPDKAPVGAAAIQEAEVPSNYQVVYTRKITGEVVTAASMQEVSFTVVGPGAKLKVYVPLTAPAGAASVLETQPIGAVGGWRNVSPAVNAATGDAIMTTILPVETAEELFLALGEDFAMNTIPAEVVDPVVVSNTIAYWENVAGSSQGQLIPVFELTVEYTDGNSNAQNTELFYMPASPEFMRPQARILNAPAIVTAGDVITLTAADAGQTIQANGLGAFDFVPGFLGAGGTYLYKWYIGNPEDDNEIPGCSGNVCSFTAPTAAAGKGAFDVTLVVVDGDSPNQSQGTDTVSILAPTVYLPAITNN